MIKLLEMSTESVWEVWSAAFGTVLPTYG